MFVCTKLMLTSGCVTSPLLQSITESWTKPEMADSELAVDGYKLFRKNQRSKGHGAGRVLLYVKSSFNAVERWDMCNEIFKESVWCEIQLKKSKLLVGVCYRVQMPPKKPIKECTNCWKG